MPNDAEPRCAACGAAAPRGSKFCPYCGHPFVADDAGEQRRVVSIVFADLVGFTALSEGRDPESVKEVLDDCFGLLIPIVEAHGGTIDKIIGDELMATFGASLAHQDDPERAVHSALELIEALEVSTFDLQLRVGVNTGEVLAGAVGPGGAFTVTGDAVNTAHRLVEIAEPGQVVVGAGTHVATKSEIDYVTLDPVAIRGKQDRVPVWVATGLRGQPTAPTTQSVEIEFIGREHERDWLAEQIQSSLATPHPVVVSISGEAGVGKTRLVNETLAQLDPTAQRTVRITCRPYGDVQSVATTADLVRVLLDIDPSSSSDHQIASINARVAELAEIAQVPETVLADRLAVLINPSTDRPTRGAPAAGAPRTTSPNNPANVLRPLLVGVATAAPTLVILDDVHWAEPGLFTVLSGLPASLGIVPVVIVAIGRSELIDRYPVLFSGGVDLPALVIEQLPRDDAQDLLHSLVLRHAAGSDDAARLGPDSEENLLEAAGGNPLLLGQLVSYLADRGELRTGRAQVGAVADADEMVLPDGIRSLLWARIDALPTAERRFLLDAAIVGSRFWPELVGELGDADAADEHLRALVDKGLVEPVDEQGDGTYAFCHRLARDAAYAAVPLAERAEKHARIARWIERAVPAPHAHRMAANLAVHVEQAVLLNRNLEHTDPGLAGAAFRTLIRAGEEAERLESMREAERWYRRAMHLGTFDLEDRRSAELGLSRVLMHLRHLDEAVLVLDALLLDLTALGDGLDILADAITLRAVAWRLQGNVDAARAGFDEALQLLDAAGDLTGQARTLRQAGWAELMSGRPRRALQRLRRASDLLGRDAPAGERGETLRYLGWCEFLVGEPDAARNLERAADVLSTAGDIGAAQWCQGILGFLYLQNGELEIVVSIAEQLIVDAHRRGESWSESTCTLLLGAARLEAGDTIEAASLLDRAARWFLELGDSWGQVIADLVNGMIARATGNLDRAAEHLHRALATAPSVAYLGEESRVLVELSRVALDRGDIPEADRRARSALALIRSGAGDAESGIRALRTLAECAVLSDDEITAILLLEEAVANGMEMSNEQPMVSLSTRQATARLASLLYGRGDRDRADQLLGQASAGPRVSLATQVDVALAEAAGAARAGRSVDAIGVLVAVLAQFPHSSHVLLDTVRKNLSALRDGGEGFQALSTGPDRTD